MVSRKNQTRTPLKRPMYTVMDAQGQFEAPPSRQGLVYRDRTGLGMNACAIILLFISSYLYLLLTPSENKVIIKAGKDQQRQTEAKISHC